MENNTQHEVEKKRGGLAGVIEDAVKAGILPKGGEDELEGETMETALDVLEMLSDDCNINQGYMVATLLEALGVSPCMIHEFLFGVTVGRRLGRMETASLKTLSGLKSGNSRPKKW